MGPEKWLVTAVYLKGANTMRKRKLPNFVWDETFTNQAICILTKQVYKNRKSIIFAVIIGATAFYAHHKEIEKLRMKVNRLDHDLDELWGDVADLQLQNRVECNEVNSDE